MRNRQKLKTAKDITKDIFEIERRKFFELDKKAELVNENETPPTKI